MKALSWMVAPVRHLESYIQPTMTEHMIITEFVLPRFVFGESWTAYTKLLQEKKMENFSRVIENCTNIKENRRELFTRGFRSIWIIVVIKDFFFTIVKTCLTETVTKTIKITPRFPIVLYDLLFRFARRRDEIKLQTKNSSWKAIIGSNVNLTFFVFTEAF